MARIRITLEQVRQVWEGMTSRRFYGDFQQWRRGKGWLWALAGVLVLGDWSAGCCGSNSSAR